MAPKLTKVIRLDNLPLNQTYFTEEGYLKDRPILTRTGIFEYTNEDGSIRKELRLPEDVFEAESLSSYKGKPIIVTHDAGLVNKDNVHQEQIGTILSEGYRSGNEVRAEIIIHDTDVLKQSGLRELSLGYSLDLDETPGEWNGQHYDAVQKNIRINHLALVGEARAGERARLNIDSRDKEGGKKMSKKNRGDGVLSPEQLEKAINDYKNRRAQRIASKSDEGDKEPVKGVEPSVPVNADNEPATETPVLDTNAPVEEQVEVLKEKRDRRDTEDEPDTVEKAMGVIANQDEDISVLFDIIDTLLAEKQFDAAGKAEGVPTDGMNGDGEGDDGDPDTDDDKGTDDNLDGDDDAIPTKKPEDVAPVMNADSIDSIVRQRIEVGSIGRLLNMDGLENMSILTAKKAIVKAVRPTMNLDGKDGVFVDVAYTMAVEEAKARATKDTSYQKRQMFNADSAVAAAKDENSSVSARQRMIERQQNRNKEVK